MRRLKRSWVSRTEGLLTESEAWHSMAHSWLGLAGAQKGVWSKKTVSLEADSKESCVPCLPHAVWEETPFSVTISYPWTCSSHGPH